ncbi:hypothetical protein CAI21_04355 [Alkalilimnicola ehrlichii]|uniref:Phosphofructokinase n=1 Tax=Alkalilimnicola ehrlichii TaxID=351052 RepID=A0A3E0X1X5_9GAMM|nr:1-phosphofructokinase family hexose kinase [Alkalilimnicola ehrlichii]RFA30746.1 hypothetical protein CAI21_04355 [Alkalilimnicola ehrlichii]RFA38322.1 hypothetical protein CAL65_05720 [Alkalilimnicola ehrlichii]
MANRILTLTMNPTVDVTVAVDALVPEHKLRTGSARYDPGGGGINVARGIHRCGGNVLAIYTAGGAVGEMLSCLLGDEGLAHCPIQIGRVTRESITVQASDTGAHYRFVLPGPELTLDETERCLRAMRDRAESRHWLASGSLPPGVGVDFYARLARAARGAGARLFLDTSGEPLRAALAEGVYMIKPNLAELAELWGLADAQGFDRRAACRELVAQGGVEVVVLSLGAEGALLTDCRQQLHIPAPPVRADSVVGAGDSFMALFVLQQARGMTTVQATHYGVAAGTAAALTPATALFRPEDIDTLCVEIGCESAEGASGRPRR